MDVFLETERLILRRFTAADLDILVELDADPDVMFHITGGVPTSREETDEDVLPAFLEYYRRYPGSTRVSRSSVCAESSPRRCWSTRRPGG